MGNDRLKILAIDDNEDNLISVKALIREAFPQALVLTATAAGKGIELAQTENPDVILMDVVMPGMDGFGACQQLKSNPLTRCIPVVFLTAIKGDNEARIRALEVGAEAFLPKPINATELTAQIRAMQKIKAASARERAEKENLTELVAARTRELDLAHTATLKLLEDLRKENEARRRSEEAYRLLFENLPSGVVVHAADTAVLFANPEALRLLGLTLEQMQGKTATDRAWCFVRDDGGSLPLEDYPVNRVRSSGEALTGQIIGIRLPGRAEPNWVQCSAYPQLDASGQISQVIVAFTDITARKQAEEALLKANEHLAYAQSAARAGMWDWDMATGTLAWSPEMLRLFEFDPNTSSPTFELWRSALHPEDRAKAEERIHQAVLDHRPLENEYRIVTPSGRVIWIGAQGNTSYGADGTPLRMSGICIDITARKQADAKLNEQLDELRRWQVVTLGRENRVQELKREVNDVCRCLGEPARYTSQETGAPDSGEARP